MKYIRTKDNIYEFEQIKLLNIGAIGEAIKQADTIEELCDYIFLFDNEITIRKIIHENDEQVIQWLKECVELGMKVKLAILTDKGLIYVAKMNNERKLELI